MIEVLFIVKIDTPFTIINFINYIYIFLYFRYLIQSWLQMQLNLIHLYQGLPKNIDESLNHLRVSGITIKYETTKKLLPIKNFKVHQKPKIDHLNESWCHLRNAVAAIQQSRPLQANLTWEDLYRFVDYLITQSCSPAQLYMDLRDLIEMHIKSCLRQFLMDATDQLTFLRQLNNFWIQHCHQMKTICNIFLALDRGYVLQNEQVSSIWDMGLELFRTHILEEVCKNRYVDGLLLMIEKERSGETIDRSLIKSLLRMLSSVQLYHVVFENKFIAVTEQHYLSEGQRLMQERNVPQYLAHVDKKLYEENARVLHYLDLTTKDSLIYCVEKQLLIEHKTKILQEGLNMMLEQNCLIDLLTRIEGGSEDLCTQLNSYIKTNGKNIVNNPEKDMSMVQELFDFKEKMNAVVKSCFANTDKFMLTIKQAFEHFINQRHNKPAELIAKFVDEKLRAGNKKVTENAMECVLDKIMGLFRFIHEKAVFESFYRKDLAKRLLVGKSVSFDLEKSMLGKLKQECGSGFTSKLEEMFNDINLSNNVMLSFKKHLQDDHNENISVDLNVNILDMEYWPNFQPMEIKLPGEMVHAQQMFTKFYLSMHSGRKLQWQPTLNHCVLKATFLQGTKELEVSLLQALVLLMFNESDTLTLAQISSRTNIDDRELRLILQSLACGKAQVLLKIPRSKEVTENDKFIYNKDFTNQRFKIRINQIQIKENREEQQQTKERIFQDCQYQIDAAIVRIMKIRKVLTHDLLFTELCNQLKFPIKPTDFKKRIESLIDLDYIKRHKESLNTYNYVA